MKRSLLTVCCLVLAASVAGCAVDGEDTESSALSESEQGLSLGEAPPATSPEDATTDGRGEAYPQAIPAWAAAGTATGVGPCPERDVRRVTSDSSVRAAADGDRPRPEPWYGSGSTTAGMKTNQLVVRLGQASRPRRDA